MKKISGFLVTLFIVSTTFSQDSIFIYNYQQFRSLVDSNKTFSLYLVPYKSSDVQQITSFVTIDHLKNAYHFLKNKKSVKNNPDFKMAIMIDDLELEYYDQLNLTDETYIPNYHYSLDFIMIIETNDKKVYMFPLAIDEKVVLNRKADRNSLAEFQAHLNNVLLKYKNYYIDRVDW